jgi:SAM-dependent methyltransferase
MTADSSGWNKEVEASYFKRIPEEALHQSLEKPFSQSDRGRLLMEIGVVISLLPDPPARILDMGCGTGWTSAFLARCGYEVLGVDFSPEAIETAASAHQLAGLTFAAQDWDVPIPPEAGAFDAAVFFDCLHHSDDERAPLRTAYAALRPGGICITCEPGTGHAASPGSVHAMATFGVNERDMPPRQVVAAGRDAGFTSATVLPHPQLVHQAVYGTRPTTSAKDRLLSSRVGRFALALRAVSVQEQRWAVVVLSK